MPAVGTLPETVNAPVAEGSSEGASSTTSTSYQDKVKLEFAGPATRYRIDWCYEVQSTKESNVYARVVVDQLGVSPITLAEPQHRSVENDGFVSGHAFAYLTLEEGSHTVVLSYRSGGGGTATMRYARVSVEKAGK